LISLTRLLTIVVAKHYNLNERLRVNIQISYVLPYFNTSKIITNSHIHVFNFCLLFFVFLLGLLHTMTEGQEAVNFQIRLRDTKNSASQSFTLEAKVQMLSLSINSCMAIIFSIKATNSQRKGGIDMNGNPNNGREWLRGRQLFS
jgi:hypothetical protein